MDVCKAGRQEIKHHLWGTIESWGQGGRGRQRWSVGYPQGVKTSVRCCERDVQGGCRGERREQATLKMKKEETEMRLKMTVLVCGQV